MARGLEERATYHTHWAPVLAPAASPPPPFSCDSCAGSQGRRTSPGKPSWTAPCPQALAASPLLHVPQLQSSQWVLGGLACWRHWSESSACWPQECCTRLGCLDPACVQPREQHNELHTQLPSAKRWRICAPRPGQLLRDSTLGLFQGTLLSSEDSRTQPLSVEGLAGAANTVDAGAAVSTTWTCGERGRGPETPHPCSPLDLGWLLLPQGLASKALVK